jgi:transposase
VGFEFLLADETSTFLEGQAAGNAKAARGSARDHRPDCPQVCLGLVVSPEGLPLAYEVFAGNRTDVTTLAAIVTTMETKSGQAQRIWVLDRGMVSDANLAFLREREAHYLVGTPRAQRREFEAALLEEKNWHEVRPEVEVKLLAHPAGRGQEQFVLCRSRARREKEQALLVRQEQRLWAQLLKIDARWRLKPSADRAAVERRIGRWLGRYPAADQLFEVRVAVDESGRACGLVLACRLERSQWTKRAPGAYLLRTDCLESDPAKLWDWYLQWQQAEAAFRIGQSDLLLRPIFHQKTQRVEAHILICFLALALWRTWEQWMKSRGLGSCARQLVGAIATIQSMDVVLPVRQGEQTVELHLRTVAKPDRLVAELLARLGLHLPARSRKVENVVAKITF